ncbi:acetyl-CoA carboxylase biotin carboxylase subunit [Tunicatimonas pelagia]|uniref:acetyl-CoA carboxylase biotin carboxylase subunit n=1 Tax=Tunicatimonas pelagia TaxID=931531 RepID=UPI002665ECC0|nr:acetyl-CoA carboxylase biotin carboxylase subunit [Tunicatimonas pelagia]WKN41982.1 acetyl-CoA carboxylase biotin carboxylase subunit [Tunicatimonas pelagia]
MKSIRRILIANRGEIAVRIIRSARELGIETVAVYSDADRLAPHVQLADFAVNIGPALSAQSYLNIPNILKACQQTEADAIHPGYGFLSENAEFARRVEEAGIIFVGPSPSAISTMGSKLAAKAAVSAFDVPLVPGTDKPIENETEAKQIARKIGYPVLIKASAGGGGKGMRIVHSEDQLAEQMERAVSEATSAFGDGSVFIEKFITAPKHIEIQIVGDQHGNYAYLFERECSIQRRYQKVIEEAPSAIVSDKMREAMGQAAIEVARACQYEGAGTVEFVVGDDLKFYFLEMNTRLQVEHPVTELITGVDLVKEQIHIAEGHPLSFSQDDLTIRGHALEVRVYAEDPTNNFLPDTGTLQTYRCPQGPGVRVDDGIEQGMDISVYYDPMIAKLVTYGQDREEAIARMLRAIGEYQISGVATTLPFCRFVLQHPEFISGRFTTKFVDEYYQPENLTEELTSDEQTLAVALAGKLLLEQQQRSKPLEPTFSSSVNRFWKSRRFE